MQNLKDKVPISINNLNEFCRTCLKECQDEGYNVHALPLPLLRLFKKYASDESSREHQLFPSFLCPQCYGILKDFSEFCSKASRCTQVLKEILNVESDGESISENLETDPLQDELISMQESPEIVDNEIEADLQLEQSEEMDFEEMLINAQTESLSCDEDLTLKPSEVAKKYSLAQEPFTKEKHLSASSLYKCPHCTRNYHFPRHLSKHLTEVHKMSETFIVCRDKQCKMTFHHKEIEEQHYKLHHELGLKVLKPRDTGCICEDCGRSFKTMRILAVHRYKHLPEEERPFHCEICDKRFVVKRNFIEHQLRHAGIKAHECTICGIKKINSRELRDHMNFHTKEKQYPCSSCSRVFNRPSNLVMHTKIIHRKIKNYKCRFCNDTFGKPDTLKYHEMRHTGERPHECNICGKSFIQPSALKSHQKRHENKKTKKLKISPKNEK